MAACTGDPDIDPLLSKARISAFPLDDLTV